MEVKEQPILAERRVFRLAEGAVLKRGEGVGSLEGFGKVLVFLARGSLRFTKVLEKHDLTTLNKHGTRVKGTWYGFGRCSLVDYICAPHAPKEECVARPVAGLGKRLQLIIVRERADHLPA